MKNSPFTPRRILINLDSRVQLAIIGVIVGTLGGFAALGLNYSLRKMGQWLAGYKKDVFIIFLPVFGLLLTIFLLKFLIKDHGGHGVPEVILSINMKGGYLKFRSAFSKLLGSLLTISAGGSAGPEAPVAISGASIGSNIATYFKANNRVRIAASASGAAAAIASIFNAPITGFIFAMEVILGEWSTINMLPVAIASVTGTTISRIFKGDQIPFIHNLIEVNVNDILATAGFSLLIAAFAITFIHLLKRVQKLLQRYLKSLFLRGALAGLAVGVFVFVFPAVRGEGYGVVRDLITGNFRVEMGIIFILILGKILATSFTLGGGGAGGIFAPSLVVGGLTGYLYHGLLMIFFSSTVFSSQAMFVLCGMAGMTSSTLHAPLTGIFLIVEITGGYDVILPLLLISFLALTLTKIIEKNSIYHYELVEKGFMRRPRTDAKILMDIAFEELLEKDLHHVSPEMKLKELIPAITQSKRNYFPVTDPESQEYYGIIDLNTIKPFLFNADLLDTVIVEEVMRKDLPHVSADETMIDVLDKFDQSGAWSLPVIDEGRFKGLISKATLLDHYRNELKAQTEE